MTHRSSRITDIKARSLAIRRAPFSWAASKLKPTSVPSTSTSGALIAAQASWRREPRHRSSVYTTAETILIAYEDPEVARSAAGSDFTADDLLDGDHHTLYVTAPSHEQRRLRPLFETLLHSVIGRAFPRQFGGRQARRRWG